MAWDWEHDGVNYQIREYTGVMAPGKERLFKVFTEKLGEPLVPTKTLDAAGLKAWLAEHPEAPRIL